MGAADSRPRSVGEGADSSPGKLSGRSTCWDLDKPARARRGRASATAHQRQERLSSAGNRPKENRCVLRPRRQGASASPGAAVHPRFGFSGWVVRHPLVAFFGAAYLAPPASVVFPAPFGPRKPSIRPRSSEKEQSASACTDSNRLLTCWRTRPRQSRDYGGPAGGLRARPRRQQARRWPTVSGCGRRAASGTTARPAGAPLPCRLEERSGGLSRNFLKKKSG
jgi:hypothetical protein